MAKQTQTEVREPQSEHQSPTTATAAAPTEPVFAPYVGQWVLFSELAVPGKPLRSVPAQLIERALGDDDRFWNINIHRLAPIVAKFKAEFSPVPKSGCWSPQQG